MAKCSESEAIMTDRTLSEAAVVGVLEEYQTEGWPGNQLVFQWDISKRIEKKIRALPAAHDAEPVADRMREALTDVLNVITAPLPHDEDQLVKHAQQIDAAINKARAALKG